MRNPIATFLRQIGMKLNTDLGQHFLIDEGILNQIVDAGNIQPSDHILEIGPGIGVLTKELTKRAKKVTAIELDKRLIPALLIYTEQPKNLEVVQGNALSVPYPTEPYKIIANIPYHITSPLLRKCFFESDSYPVSLTLLIQREVAEKICDEKDAGILTIVVRLFGTPKLITLVPPRAFLPPPKVDSAVLQIDCFEKPLTDKKTMDKIFSLTKIAFSQKRKMLRNTFGSFPNGLELLSRAEIDPTRRPQTLSIDEWIRIAKLADETMADEA